MTPELMVGLVGVSSTIVGVGVLWGRLTEHSKNQDARMDAHDKTDREHGELLMDHGARLAGHDLQLALIEQWKSGLSDGAHLAHASSSLAAAHVAEVVEARATMVAEEVVKAAEKLAAEREA